MHCSFECSPYTTLPSTSTLQPLKRMEKIAKLARQMSAIASSSSSSPTRSTTSSATAAPTPTYRPYVHGICTFGMRLCNQCQSDVQQTWHSVYLGDEYIMWDQNRTNTLTFPTGQGRIDQGGALRLISFGDFRLAWSSLDQQVYFSFNNEFWTTATKDDGKEAGLCYWSAWDKPALNCTAGSDGEVRVSFFCFVFLVELFY